MKKAFILFLSAVLLLTAAGCGKADKDVGNMEPQITQMRSICELAVMECYYHNVAKFHEEDAVKGILGFGSKDKHFWVEYSGIVKLGIDASLVNITINDTEITVTLPDAQVLSCDLDTTSLSKDSYIVDKKSADITAEDEIEALTQAQLHLEQTAAADKALLLNAQEQAKSLLTDYINNIGNVVGKSYNITWVYVGTDG